MTNDAYQGRRRAGGPPIRFWVALAFVLVGLGVAVAIPIALTSLPESGARSGASDGAADTESGLGGSSGDTPSPSSSPSVTTTPSATLPAAPSTPQFTQVTYEAEAPKATIRGGSARVRNTQGASGKKIVNRIGDWSQSEESEATNGTLRFNTVTVPAAGTYTLAIFYAFIEEGDASRSALITVNNAAPINVPFARPAVCCPTSVRLAITLKRGVNSILFANSVSRAPAVDRIVISRA